MGLGFFLGWVPHPRHLADPRGTGFLPKLELHRYEDNGGARPGSSPLDFQLSTFNSQLLSPLANTCPDSSPLDFQLSTFNFSRI